MSANQPRIKPNSSIPMKPIRLIAIFIIFVLTTAAWWILGVTLGFRTDTYSLRTSGEVNGLWGPSLQQPHPRAFYSDASGAVSLLPSSSKVTAELAYDPRKRGLQWHRTYDIKFNGEYAFANPTQVTQHFKIELPLPGDTIRLEGFQFEVTGGAATASAAPVPKSGLMTASVEVAPGKTVRLVTGYQARGMNDWRYVFPDASRIQNFELVMHTNFSEIDFPNDTGSPSQAIAETGDNRWTIVWQYPDVISARSIGMSMPKVLNPGPVAMQIAFWAPLSLAVFFLVLVITSLMNGVELHPMNAVRLHGRRRQRAPLLHHLGYRIRVAGLRLPAPRREWSSVQNRPAHPAVLSRSLQLQLFPERPHRLDSHRRWNRHPRLDHVPHRWRRLDPRHVLLEKGTLS